MKKEIMFFVFGLMFVSLVSAVLLEDMNLTISGGNPIYAVYGNASGGELNITYVTNYFEVNEGISQGFLQFTSDRGWLHFGSIGNNTEITHWAEENETYPYYSWTEDVIVYGEIDDETIYEQVTLSHFVLGNSNASVFGATIGENHFTMWLNDVTINSEEQSPIEAKTNNGKHKGWFK